MLFFLSLTAEVAKTSENQARKHVPFGALWYAKISKSIHRNTLLDGRKTYFFKRPHDLRAVSDYYFSLEKCILHGLNEVAKIYSILLS